MALVYVHKTLDGLPFYIGVSKNKDRPFDSSKRSFHWKAISKSSGCKVEILKEDLNWLEALELEEILIKCFGRLDNKTGILVNKTDGGEGTKGRTNIISKSTREKQRIAATGKKHKESSKAKISKKVIQLDLKGNKIKEFKSIIEASRVLGISDSHICKVCKGKAKTTGGFRWKYKTEEN